MSTLAKTLSLISALFMLTACGGGGSSVSRDNTDNGSGDDGTTTSTYSIALSLENESGASDNNLSENNSLYAVATVTDEDGNPHSNALLTFTLSNEELAEFGNDTGTERTDNNGEARIRLNASSASGGGEITATLGTGETATTTFSATAVSGADPTTIIVSLTLQNEDGESDSNLSEDNSLFAVATVADQNGNPFTDALLTPIAFLLIMALKKPGGGMRYADDCLLIIITVLTVLFFIKPDDSRKKRIEAHS